jgi:hypothetical protein
LVALAVAVPALAASLTLTWTDSATNEDGFKVERKTGSTGAFGQLATLAANATGYVDGSVTAGTTYCYRVRAYNGAGDSAYSNEACATPASATLFTVAVSKSGTGSGTVASSPSGISCGSDCSEAYASGTSVALSATPASGATFTGWSGACTGTGSCALVVDGNKSLTATFALQTYTLTLTKSGTGSGTVTSSPSGINCGTTCSNGYASGTTVTLAAAAGTGSTFAGWTGACTGTGTCAVTMDGAKTVNATFDTASAPPGAETTYTLTVKKGGSGKGTVTSSPGGITCGRDCSENYAGGTSVTLTATPASGSAFTGWGGACTGTGTCMVTLSQSTSVTASFARVRR